MMELCACTTPDPTTFAGSPACKACGRWMPEEPIPTSIQEKRLLERNPYVSSDDPEPERTGERLDLVLRTLSTRNEWTPRAFLKAHYNRLGSVTRTVNLFNRLVTLGLLTKHGKIIVNWRVTDELMRRVNRG